MDSFIYNNANNIRFTNMVIILISFIAVIITGTLWSSARTALKRTTLSAEDRTFYESQSKSLMIATIVFIVIIVLCFAIMGFMQNKGYPYPPSGY